MRASRRLAACRADGVMCCPPSRNGNMPAGPVRPRRIRGGRRSPLRMRIISSSGEARLQMWVNMRPILGAFSICTEMSMNGPRTGTRQLIRTGNRDDPQVRHRAPTVFFGAGLGTLRARPAFGLPQQLPPRASRSNFGFRVGFKQQ